MSTLRTPEGGIGRPDEDLSGRAVAPLLRGVLGLTALAAGSIGLIAYAGGLASDDFAWFAWPVASPVTAVLLGAGFVGAVPMLVHAITRTLWEEVRVPALAAGTVLAALAVVTVTAAGDTGVASGSVLDPAFLLGAAWLLGVGGLTLGALAALVAQLLEPALPLPRRASLPRWALPPVALEASGLAGLGVGLLARPGFWGPQLPWTVTTLDARMLGAWCLALGVALLAALVEDDLARLRGGLVGITGIGVLALLGLAVRHGAVEWSGWSGWCALVLVLGLTAIGGVGGLLARRETRAG